MAYGDDDDDDYPEGALSDDEMATVPCTACGKEIPEDVAACPYCGAYPMRGSTSVLSGKPLWFVIIALLGIASFILVSLF